MYVYLAVLLAVLLSGLGPWAGLAGLGLVMMCRRWVGGWHLGCVMEMDSERELVGWSVGRLVGQLRDGCSDEGPKGVWQDARYDAGEISSDTVYR